ncbi:MAG: PEP-CTERM sorting domain-containing protein [Pirellulaceae bacterium]
MPKLPVYLTTLCVLIAIGNSARGDLILSFEGEPFSEVIGDATFTTLDRLTGTFVFEGIVSIDAPVTLSATRFELEVTVGGGAGLAFDVTDAIGDFRVTQNEFDFVPGSLLPEGFVLTVSGNAFGDPGFIEELSISDIGDLATIDLGGATESNAFNFSAGTFRVSSVPEPSALAFFGLALWLFANRRSRVRISV